MADQYRSRTTWTVGETRHLLEMIRDMKVIEKLQGKHQRNQSVFRDIAFKLGPDKTVEQTRSHWKCLKKCYRVAAKERSMDGLLMPLEHPFDLLHELLAKRAVEPARRLSTRLAKASSSNNADVELPVQIKVELETVNDQNVEDSSAQDTVDEDNDDALGETSQVQVRPETEAPRKEAVPPIARTSRAGTSSDSNGSSDASVPQSRTRIPVVKSKQEVAMERYAATQERFMLQVIRQQQEWAAQEFQRQRQWENTMFGNLQTMYKDTVEDLLGGLLSVVNNAQQRQQTSSHASNGLPAAPSKQ